jgi:hypothetical protein
MGEDHLTYEPTSGFEWQDHNDRVRVIMSFVTPTVTVSWCRWCNIYDELDQVGHKCSTPECNHKLIKRVGYLCQEKPSHTYPFACRMLHWTLESLNRCQHDAC